MPVSVVVTAYPALSAEPVSLDLLKAQVREDSTDAGVVALLGQKLQAARAACEGYCGRKFASCTVQQTFEVGEPYELLPGAGTVTAVTGYYTDVDDLANLNDTGYQVEYLKGISISRDYPIGYGFRSNAPTFTVTYPVVITPEQVAPDVKEAILKVAADLYENRENSISGTIQGPLEVGIQVLLAPYRLTNPLFQ